MLPPLNYFRKYWKSALRSSAVGTVIGAIPGAGANIAAFVSYNFGERATGKKFTEGDIEGVVCSEVANNACCGGALLPTITLGIPGNSSCALIIAALSLHGITLGPGINMDHPGFMHFIYASLLIRQFLHVHGGVPADPAEHLSALAAVRDCYADGRAVVPDRNLRRLLFHVRHRRHVYFRRHRLSVCIAPAIRSRR